MSIKAALDHVNAAIKKLEAGMYMSSYETQIVADLKRAKMELGDTTDVSPCESCGDEFPQVELSQGWCFDCICHDHAIMNGKL